MSASRPWWASEGPVDGGVDPAEDPLIAHRSARRGGGEPDPDTGDPDTADPDTADPDTAGHDAAEDEAAGPTPPGSASGPTQPGSASGPTQPGSAICGVCPVCVAARMLGETRPELLGHLTEAGRHLSAALSSLLETRTDRSSDEQGEAPDSRRVRRIDLD